MLSQRLVPLLLRRVKGFASRGYVSVEHRKSEPD